MTGSEQLPLDIEVEQTPWGKWVDPQRRAAQVHKFMEYAGLQQIPAEPWDVDSLEVKRVDPFVAYLFPDMATAMASVDADLVDAFICFMGECFIRYAGAEWIDDDWQGREYSFYEDVNPALLIDSEDEDIVTVWGLIDNMISHFRRDDEGMFSYLCAVLHEYQGYHHDKLRDHRLM